MAFAVDVEIIDLPLIRDLDVNGKSIISTSNGNIVFAPNGSGNVLVTLGTGYLSADTSQQFKLHPAGNDGLAHIQVGGSKYLQFGVSALNLGGSYDLRFFSDTPAEGAIFSTQTIGIEPDTGDIWLYTGSINIDSDSEAIVWGEGQDASIYYDGTNLVCAPRLVGTGSFKVLSGLVLPNGAGGPTISGVGQIGVDSTSATLNFHDGTAERTLSPVRQISITVENPGSAEDLSIILADRAITITKIRAVLVGSSTPSVTWTVRHGSDRSAAGTEVVTGGTTTTSTTTGDSVMSFNDATVAADSWIWLESTAKSGTVTLITVTIFYREDA